MQPSEITAAAECIDKASVSLITAIKYVYLISDSDFYNVNVKDIFKVTLSDITRPDILDNLGLRLEPDKLGDLAGEGFASVAALLRYAFAVRLPFLKRILPKGSVSDRDIKAIYAAVGAIGMENTDGLIELELKSAFKLAKSRSSEPYFDSGWFRRWVYSTENSLAAINNRNMFTLGCIDALFPLYYSALTETLSSIIQK